MSKLKQYRSHIIKFVFVFSAMFGLGYGTAEYFTFKGSTSLNQSPSLSSLLFNAKMGKSLSFVNVQLEAPEIPENPNDLTEISAYITLLKSSNSSIKYQWLLPDGVQVVEGQLDGQLDSVVVEEPVEIVLVVKGYSSSEKKLIALTAGTLVGDTPVSNVALISSRPEDSYEYVAKQKFDSDQMQKLDLSSQSPQDLRSQEDKIQR